jgi:excisionase family DNA binding protein
MSDQILISRREAAKMLSISLRTMDYLISAKEIPVRRIHRRTLIPVAALRQFARYDHLTQLREENEPASLQEAPEEPERATEPESQPL